MLFLFIHLELFELEFGPEVDGIAKTFTQVKVVILRKSSDPMQLLKLE